MKTNCVRKEKKMIHKKYAELKEEQEALLSRKNKKTEFYNGILDRYEHPVLTRDHTPLHWRYDLDAETNPYFMERLGVNAVMNAGAIELDGKFYLVARVEGADRKSFFAVAESESGTEGFRFWDYPVALPDTCPEETNVYDMRLTKHEDGYIYGVFCSERKDRSDPELSAAVAEAGIVRTKDLKYNGYKVYWEDGAQITPPHDQNILEEVGKVTELSMVKTMEEDEAKKAGLLRGIGKELDDAYMEQLKSQSIHPELIRKAAKDIRVVYTPLHGTGNLPVRRVLKELGFEQVYVVKEQELPDGNFPTVAYPNPEDEKAWALALKLARKVDADLVLATDPDADRLGVYVKDGKTGSYMSFTGNMSGTLIAEYILRERKKAGTLPEDPVVVETIVTTDMVKAVGTAYGVEVREVLTGFKYIGEQIKRMEEEGRGHYVFGLEESYGCLAGTYARDKDACVAVMMLCEAAAFYKLQGKTLWDVMTEMYEAYGWYREGLTSVTRKGMDGAEEIRAGMQKLREHPPEKLGGSRVLAIRDYQAGIRRETATGRETAVALPPSNVLYFELEGDGWCCVRPSGTEPKIKYYYGVKGGSAKEAEHLLARYAREIPEVFNAGMHTAAER